MRSQRRNRCDPGTFGHALRTSPPPPRNAPNPAHSRDFLSEVPSQLPAAPAVHLNTGRKRRPEHDVEAAFVASGLFAMLSEIVYAAIPYKCWSDTPGPKV